MNSFLIFIFGPLTCDGLCCKHLCPYMTSLIGLFWEQFGYVEVAYLAFLRLSSWEINVQIMSLYFCVLVQTQLVKATASPAPSGQWHLTPLQSSRSGPCLLRGYLQLSSEDLYGLVFFQSKTVHLSVPTVHWGRSSLLRICCAVHRSNALRCDGYVKPSEGLQRGTRKESVRLWEWQRDFWPNTRGKCHVGAFVNCGSGAFKLTWVDKMVASKGISFEGLISCVWEREQKDNVSMETSLDVNQLCWNLTW